MRLQQYITEGNNDKYSNDIAIKAWMMIKEKCKPFLKEWLPIYKRDKLFLYRGMRGVSTHYGEKKVRRDRTPESSDYWLHKHMDDMFNQKFGFRARTNAVFVTGVQGGHSYYGPQYLIFPAGKYKFIWSPAVRDLYSDASALGYYKGMELSDIHVERQMVMLGKDLKDGEARKEVRKMLHLRNEEAIRNIAAMYKKNDLRAAIKSGNEIMINCDSYIYIHFRLAYDIGNLINDEIK